MKKYYLLFILFISFSCEEIFTDTQDLIDRVHTPSNLKVEEIAWNTIDLSWQDNSAYEDGFILERSTDGIDFIEIKKLNSNIESYQDIGLDAERTYYYRIKAFNSDGNSPYSEIASKVTPYNTIPLAHWKFDEGTGFVAHNSVDNTLLGAINGSPEWAEGKIGEYSLEFYGVGTYTEYPDVVTIDPDSRFLTEKFTISVWAYPEEYPPHEYYPSGKDMVAPYISLYKIWHIPYDKGVWNFLFENEYSELDISTTEPISLDPGGSFFKYEWHHYVVIVNTVSGDVSFYTDGVFKNTLSNDLIKEFDSAYYAASPIYIGTYEPGNEYNWRGKIDDLRFYTELLTAEEILALYEMGNW